jgi:hypothetical protein
MGKRKVIRINLQEEKSIEKIREVSLILQEQLERLEKENEMLKKNFKLTMHQTPLPPEQK